MLSSNQWRALYTKPGQEKKVASLLTARNIENYCPVNTVYSPWIDRKKTTTPLFHRYVFAKTGDDNHSLALSTAGVINFVYWLNTPAVIHDEEITLIKEFLDEHENVQLERITVQNEDRALMKTGILLLPSLGFILSGEMAQVEFL